MRDIKDSESMDDKSSNTVIKSRGVVNSLFWKFAERCGAQISSFVISMVLARKLMPEEYGVISILLIFITLSQVLVQSGLGTALVQKEKVDNKDYSAVLYVSFAISVMVYAVIFAVAPSISLFFEIPLITPTLRVMAVSLLFGAGSAVLNSMLVKNMEFHKLFLCNISASVISGIVGIVMAYVGFGVWALVFQYVANQALSLLIMGIIVRWIPCGLSAVKHVKPLFKYGYKILIANLIGTGYNELRSLAIGKKYDGATLAFYDKGKQFPHLIISNLNTTIDNVMLPVYSASQKDTLKLKQMIRRSMKVSSYVIFPLIAGLCVTAKPLVSILLTNKWLPCVPYMILNALIYALAPLQTANAQVINAIGRSDIFLKLEIIKKTLGIVILALSLIIFDDVIFVAYGGLLIAVLSSLINMTPNTRLIKYSYKEQLLDLAPATVMSIVMAAIIWSVSLVIRNNYLLFFTQVVLGVVVYVLLSVITKNTTMKYVLVMIKGKK